MLGEINYECHDCGWIAAHEGLSTPEEEHIKNGHGDNISCPNCGETSWRIFSFNVGSESYAHPIISDSLAMNPNQIAEHRELFPNIEVTPAGQPVFKDFKSHDAYLKKTGFVKMPKKIDGRKKEIIG